MMMMLLFVALFGLLIMGVPVALALAGASLIYIVVDGRLPDFVLIHRMVNGVDSFPLLAVPFFILAGNLMNTGGITNRIYDFAVAAVGWMRGGLGHVNVVGSVIFAGMSGTAVADAGGLGTVEIKAMRDHGYDAKFAVGITAASATIGPIIPPSLPFVIYAVMANTSVGQLFAAGIIPGLMMAGALMIMVTYFAHVRGYDRDAVFRVAVLVHTFGRAFLALMTPVILIGGMMSGAFTPTEAAVAASVYALLLGLWYGTLNLRQIVRVSMETIETTASVLLIVAASSIFAWILTTNRITEHFATLVLGFTNEPWMVLLLINLILLVVGCFLETIAAITILVPVFLPIILKLEIDPVHFGLVMVLNLMIGLLTPPVGMVLYVLSRVAKLSFEDCAKAVAPFLVPLVAVLIIVTYLPGLYMWLPVMLYR